MAVLEAETNGHDRSMRFAARSEEYGMSDGDALFAAILTHPAEDTPRLAYADWLDEHGDPDRAAACFQLQIEAARLPDGDARRADLEVAARLLVVAHLDAWLGPLRTLATNWLFVRGFPERLTVLHEVFLDHADEILAAAPVQSVFFLQGEAPTGWPARGDAAVGPRAGVELLARRPERKGRRSADRIAAPGRHAVAKPGVEPDS